MAQNGGSKEMMTENGEVTWENGRQDAFEQGYLNFKFSVIRNCISSSISIRGCLERDICRPIGCQAQTRTNTSQHSSVPLTLK